MRSQSKKRPIKESSGVRIRQCTVYEPDFKKAVVSFAEQKGTSEAKKRYGISESNIRRWRKIEDKRREISLGKNITNIQQMEDKKFKKAIVNDGKQDDDIANQLDSMPLNERLKTTQNDLETVLQSQPLSPTKLKVTRQNKQSHFLGKSQHTLALSAQLPPSSPEPIEEISLKWNNYQSNMQSMFPNLLSKEQYVDVTLVADGRAIKCHRVILSSCSPYFEETLSNISPFQHPVLFLKDVPFWVLKTLCDFMYTGEVKILQPKLEELITVAENLKIKGLAGKLDCANDITKPVILKPIKEEKTDDMNHIKEKESDKKDVKEKRKSTCTPPDMPVLKNEKLPPKATENSEMPLLKRSKILKFRNPLRKSDKPSKTLSKELVSKKDILDPFDLLEPIYEEVQKESRTVAPKENKSLPMKKSIAKKVKKRKITEERDESPPPIFLKKGTRSRPIRKIPKYYDITSGSIPKEPESLESTIVREPHTHQTDPLLQPEDIKTEPLDLDENIIEIEDNVIEFNDDITLQEDIIGDYDCSLINFERDKIAGEKPPLKDVKIVDVTQIKDSEEGPTEYMEEDPLNINQSTESTITITDVHSLVENKEDSLDNVCNELGFRISEIHSQTSISICKEAVETREGILGFQVPSAVENEKDNSTQKNDVFKIHIGSFKTDKQTFENEPNANVIQEKPEGLSETSDIIVPENNMEVDETDCINICDPIEVESVLTNAAIDINPKKLTGNPRNNIYDLEETEEIAEISMNLCDIEESEINAPSSKQLEENGNIKDCDNRKVDFSATNRSAIFKLNSSVDDPVAIPETESVQMDSTMRDEEEKHTEFERMDFPRTSIHHSEDDNCVLENKLEESEINLGLELIQNDAFQYSLDTINNEEYPAINEVTSNLCSQDVLITSSLEANKDPLHSDGKEFNLSTKHDDSSITDTLEISETNHKIVDNTDSVGHNVEFREASENHIVYMKEGESSFSQGCVDFSSSKFNMEPPMVPEEISLSEYKENQNSNDDNYVNSVYKENEMETIVNDLTKIVSESQNEMSSEDVQDDIEESLANLLK